MFFRTTWSPEGPPRFQTMAEQIEEHHRAERFNDPFENVFRDE